MRRSPFDAGYDNSLLSGEFFMNQPVRFPTSLKKLCAGNFTALGNSVLPLFDVGLDKRQAASDVPPLTRTPRLRMSVTNPKFDHDDEAEVLPSLRKMK